MKEGTTEPQNFEKEEVHFLRRAIFINSLTLAASLVVRKITATHGLEQVNTLSWFLTFGSGFMIGLDSFELFFLNRSRNGHDANE